MKARAALEWVLIAASSSFLNIPNWNSCSSKLFSLFQILRLTLLVNAWVFKPVCKKDQSRMPAIPSLNTVHPHLSIRQSCIVLFCCLHFQAADTVLPRMQSSNSAVNTCQNELSAVNTCCSSSDNILLCIFKHKA